MKEVSKCYDVIDRIPNPHGGKLVNQFLESKNLTDDMYHIDVDDDLRNDIENIADGIFSPLDGFVEKDDFESILTSGRLKMDYHGRYR
jgi:sulfate adenylyltransferase